MTVNLITLAAVDIAQVSQRARSTSGLSNNLEFVVWGALALAGLWAILHYWSRIRRTVMHQADSPQSLFQELCSVHRLDRAQRGLILQAAEAARLADPAIAFVDPDLLLAAARAPHADAVACAALAERLFGREAAE